MGRPRWSAEVWSKLAATGAACRVTHGPPGPPPPRAVAERVAGGLYQYAHQRHCLLALRFCVLRESRPRGCDRLHHAVYAGSAAELDQGVDSTLARFKAEVSGSEKLSRSASATLVFRI